MSCSTLPACPAGSFTFTVAANGDLNIVFDQFPAPNDNSYGVNAVGWGTKGHKFGDLVGSDHAGFQLIDPSGTVRLLDFNIDYISASTDARRPATSRSAPFGGDGKVLIGHAHSGRHHLHVVAGEELEQRQHPRTVQRGARAAVRQRQRAGRTRRRPMRSHQTYVDSDPALAGWDFHDTYFVTISAAKLASIGFNTAAWKVEPNLDALHNSPAKPCPPSGGTGSRNSERDQDRGQKTNR